MSRKAKNTLNKIISYAGIFFFILAAAMLWWQLRDYRFIDIVRAIASIPIVNLVAACVACFVGYVALGTYDYLALRYVGARVAWWKWMMAGMLGFAISNNAGHAVVSGGAIRYRLYSRWRISGGDIVKMLTFSGFTYFLGCSAIVIIGYFLVPHEILGASGAAAVGINTLFIICAAALIAYFAMAILFRGNGVRIGQVRFTMPDIQTALIQTALGITDSVLAGLVLYCCIAPFAHIPFGIFIGLFVIAQATGVFSQVPGGIGVFESIFMLALPAGVDRADVFGALLAYRIIYYVLPLIGIGGVFFVYERWLRVRMRRWLDDARRKIPTLGRGGKNQ